MNYHYITKDDMVNGDGIRVVLWVAGCNHHCKDCHNPETWDLNGGKPFTDDVKKEIFDELAKDHVSGITFTGGDPLHPNNKETITSLSHEIKDKFPNKTQWLYTGFTWEEVKDLDIMNYLDVVIDGEFETANRDVTLKWRGSANQNVINVQKSLAENNLITYCN